MCPFCIGAAAWAAAGMLSTAGGLGVLAAVVQRRATGDAKYQAVNPATDGSAAEGGESLASSPAS